MLDEPAHLATAGLLLPAAYPGSWEHPAFVTAALVGSVAIDLDHLPELLGWTAPSPSRPATHSLMLPLCLAAIAATLPDRWRPIMNGLSNGVAIHLVRDLATGGVPLGAPLTRKIICLPYSIYALWLVAAAARTIWLRHSSARVEFSNPKCVRWYDEGR